MSEPRPWLCSCHQQRVHWMWTTGHVLCSITRAVIARMPQRSNGASTEESKA